MSIPFGQDGVMSPHVLYVAVQSRRYPRNSRIRNYLEQRLHATVDVLDLSPRRGYLRHCVELLSTTIPRRRRQYDIIVLAEMSLAFAPVSWFLSRVYRALHVVDFFIGTYETQVEDRHAVSRFSPQALIYRLIDWFAAWSADLVLSDTEARAARWRSYRRPTLNLPVGAPPWATPLPLTPHGETVRFLYYGNYIPLHGVPSIVRALAALRTNLNFSATFVGDGEERLRVERLVRELDLVDVVIFLDAIPETDLADTISEHHVILGAFGTSGKAQGVIPNKVWQGLCCGRVVVTRPGEGVAEIRPMTEGQLFLPQELSTESIAQALLQGAQHLDTNFTVNIGRLQAYVEGRFDGLGRWVLGGRAE